MWETIATGITEGLVDADAAARRVAVFEDRREHAAYALAGATGAVRAGRR